MMPAPSAIEKQSLVAVYRRAQASQYAADFSENQITGCTIDLRGELMFDSLLYHESGVLPQWYLLHVFDG